MRALLKPHFLGLFFFCLSLSASVSGGPLADSLTQRLPFDLTASTAQEKVDLLNRFSYNFAWKNPQRAIAYAEYALELALNDDYTQGIAHSYYTMGWISMLLGDNSGALEDYQNALDLYNSLADQPHIALVKGAMAGVYVALGDLNEAEELIAIAIEESELLNDTTALAAHLLVKGELMRKLGKTHISLLSLEKSLTLAKATGNRTAMGFAHIEIGEFYTQVGDYEVAFRHFIEAGVILDKAENKIGGMDNLIALSRSLIESKRYDRALTHLDYALNITKEMNSVGRRMQVYELISKLHLALGDYKNSLASYQQFTALKDSVFSDNNARKIARLKIEYNADHQASEMDKMRTKEEVQTVKIWFLILLLVVVSGGFLFWRYFRKKTEKQLLGQMQEIQDANQLIKLKHEQIEEINKQLTSAEKTIRQQNEELLQANNQLEDTVQQRTAELSQAVEELTVTNFELDTLIYRTSHDLKSPLSSLKGLAYLGIKESGNKITRLYFKKVKATSEQLLQQLMKLRNIYVLKNYELNLEKVNLAELISTALGEHNATISNHNIAVEVRVSKQAEVEVDKHALLVAVSCLIENAIGYRTGENPAMRIEVSKREDTVVICVSDNGLGIAEEAQPQLFSMFFRGSAISGGGGLGLYLSKLATKAMAGKIYLEKSVEGEGATFCIEVPDKR